MKRIVCLALVVLAVSVPAHLPAGDVVNGNWRLTTLATAGNSESTNLLFKVETTDGKTTATLLSVLSAAIALAPALDATYGRTDWRGAAEALETPRGTRAIIVGGFRGGPGMAYGGVPILPSAHPSDRDPGPWIARIKLRGALISRQRE